MAGDQAVHFQAYLHPAACGGFPALAQGEADLFKGLLPRDPGVVVNPVGADLYPRRPHVPGQLGVFLGPLDVSAQFTLVQRVVLEGAAQAGQFDGRVIEAPADLGALLPAEIHLHPVGVGSSQLHSLEPRFLAVAYDGLQVPILGEVVGHQP